MAAPQAPMALRQQIKGGSNIVVTVPLRGIGPAPTFTDGGTAFNSGDPTATYTITIPSPVTQLADRDVINLLNALDDLAQKSVATIT